MSMASAGIGRVLALSAMAGVLALGSVGCTSTPDMGGLPSQTPTTPIPTQTQQPTPTATATATITPSASPKESPVSKAETDRAANTAMHLWARYPIVLSDPSAGYVWSGRTWPASPMSYGLHVRLEQLQKTDYFSDGPTGRCGEDYIVGNQSGLRSAPTKVSATANEDGTVTVVVRRVPNDSTSDISVVMTKVGDLWYATDLLRGTGPNASIYSKVPNC
jgi:hypothetical protein